MTTDNIIKGVSKVITPKSTLKAGDRKRASDAKAVNPLGEALHETLTISGFGKQSILARAAEAVPPWQRDTDEPLNQIQAPQNERRAILSAVTLLGRFGVIIDKNGGIVQGNAGWTQHVAAVATLSITNNALVPASKQSQSELTAALALLLGDHGFVSVPVALRDLDGWVTDMIHIKRVGTANPDLAYALLPKSSLDIARTLADLSMALSLTPQETDFVTAIIKGESNREIADSLNMKLSDIKRSMRQLVAKFRVRQKSDIVRIMTSFP